MQNELEVKIPFWGKNYMFYIYSALLGLGGGLGFWCMIECAAMVAFYKPGEHPISGPIYSIMGLVAFWGCLWLLHLYWRNHKYMQKKLQTILHFLIVLATFALGLQFTLFMDQYLRSILEPLIK